ncbi:DUF1538 domain-containing protein [Dehalogenimonas etheniformans]|uniref:DUF1538 domain-containing protein n=1 Tax=Dehalogenimonas etheniformans TaxID=1536648 RepID=A0A2P5P5B9_9CHLR|nr:DUF1538 domain-containing protein [Dehalogenimonas etheniformans]PPD57477.1 DUF1538 domain-containing protein [Dehalogenimonas etheniformans]QNT76840.1 DUF1538 domain-containing protein [Dehalogenimonas etheniformans]
MNGLTIFDGLLETAGSVIEAFVPLLFVLLIFQVFFLKLPPTYIMKLLKGTLIASAGLVLFLQGVKGGFLPYGHAIGVSLGNLDPKWLAVPFGLLLGFLTARSEPAVRVLCDQVEEASSGSMRKSTVLAAISIGVAIFVGLGMARITYSIPLLYILIPGYLLALVLAYLSPREYTAVAFDAGGVATGPLANTFLLSLGLGMSAAIGGQDGAIYGFGLVSFIALAPLISVMILGVLVRTVPRRRKP